MFTSPTRPDIIPPMRQTEYPPLDFLIPFGQAKVYDGDKSDVGIITYGTTVHMARRCAEILAEKGIGARVVDLRAIKPLDEETIRKTAEECGRVVVITEDRFLGGAGATISGVITSTDALTFLEAPIKLVTAIESRVAYGADGDALCLPTTEKVLAAVDEVMSY